MLSKKLILLELFIKTDVVQSSSAFAESKFGVLSKYQAIVIPLALPVIGNAVDVSPVTSIVILSQVSD